MLHSLILFMSIDCLRFAEKHLMIFQYDIAHLDCESFPATLFNFSFLTLKTLPRERRIVLTTGVLLTSSLQNENVHNYDATISLIRESQKSDSSPIS